MAIQITFRGLKVRASIHSSPFYFVNILLTQHMFWEFEYAVHRKHFFEPWKKSKFTINVNLLFKLGNFPIAALQLTELVI